MSQWAVRAQGLGKRFRIGALHSGRGMHEAVDRLVRRSMPRAVKPGENGWLWALRDASFEIGCGEVVALMGRNGAGKSVLLKILARVTAPTEGSAEILGHVAPLLEVGAGFHSELSGRQNVYFNGAILGMSRGQIRRKFDEIVAFSEIESFIDTPVKLYSSGMRMRLAFSVAVHLEPDILLIDEALAVGDAAFRSKCRDKIREFVRRGCTLMMVSHDLTILGELCKRAILVEHGSITADGEFSKVLDLYRGPLSTAAQL